MSRWTVQDLLAATAGELLYGKPELTFRTISTDTRTIQSGDAFLALQGENFDGHRFVDAAVRKGAVCVVVAQSCPIESLVRNEELAVIRVPDTLLALQQAARYYRNGFSLPLIAVTGSNGKTTTKDMIASILSQAYRTLKTHANFNNEIGLSQTLLQLTSEHEAAVVEMGMRGRGEIQQLAGIALPTIGVVTNVGMTHIERLGSIENIADAKAELVRSLPANGLAVLNADDQRVAAMADQTAARVITYGIDNGQTRAKNLVFDHQMTRFTVCSEQGSFDVCLPLPGVHNAYNALAAVTVALHLHVTPEQIARGLSELAVTGMRMQMGERADGVTVINDCYNASPASMKAALETLKDIAHGRTIAVLADMLELGDFSQQAHAAVGQTAAKLGIDQLVAVGNEARYIVVGAQQAGMKAERAVYFSEQSPAISYLSRRLQPSDTVLIKGSRGMKMEQIVAALMK